MLSNTPILYSHSELNAPAKPVAQETVQLAPSYEAVLYMCGEVSYYPAIFFIMSSVYLAPHMNTWVGIVFGAVLACVGWYALLTEDKDK